MTYQSNSFGGPVAIFLDNRACSSCLLRSQCSSPVPAEAPNSYRLLPVHLLLVGESPGEGEDQTGRPFQGPAGQFLDQLLRDNGINRASVAVSNLVKCRPADNDFDECVKTAANLVCPQLWLDREINLLRPSTIVALGAQSARYLLGDSRFSMERDHGRPVASVRFGYPTTIFPVFHPAAGFHHSQYLRHTFSDFALLGRLLQGVDPESLWPLDQYPNPDYQQVETEEDARELLHQPYYALDTETIPTPSGQKLWSVQVSSKVGTAHYIPARLIPDPQTAIPPTSLVVAHNWLYDQDFISIPTFLDTMVMAYLLQLPLGLKELARQLCGMEMDSYQDYTRPYRREKALEYLERASETDWGASVELPLEWEWDSKRRGLVQKARRPKRINLKISERLKKASLDADYDPYEKWREIDYRERAVVERVIGPMLDASLEDIPFDQAFWYSCKDPDATLRVAGVLAGELDRLGIRDTLDQLDQPMLVVAREMMQVGMQVDRSVLSRLSAQLIEMMIATVDQIEARLLQARSKGELTAAQLTALVDPKAGLVTRFNPNSSQQTARYVLGWRKEWGLPQPTTVEKMLTQVDHPVVPLVLEYRRAAKLRDSYCEKLPRYIDASGRVHPTIRVAPGTETGRLRIVDPALQTIPVRTKQGKQIRTAFHAKPGCQLLAIDLSQIEMRVLADLSRCENLIQIFQSGGDIHTLMAARAFRVSPEVVMSDEMRYRYPIKRLQYGIVYGLSAPGLYNLMKQDGIEGWGLADCESFIKRYYNENPEILDYIKREHRFALMNGYVQEPYFGRIRYIPEIRVPVRAIRGEGERMAANLPVTGGAQALMKLMTRRIWDWREQVWKPNNPGCPFSFLLQVHDELIWEVPNQAVWEVAVECKRLMEQVGDEVGLSVPVVAEAKWGPNWGEMERMAL